MPEAAGGPEVRLVSYWCRLHSCPNNAPPRRSLGIPTGWLRITLGLPEGRGHFMTFCSAACLQAMLLRRPQEFTYDPRIDRRRVEQAKQRKGRRVERKARAGAGQETRGAAPPSSSAAQAMALDQRGDAPPVVPVIETTPVVEAAPAPVPAPPARPVCPRCGSTKLVHAYAFVWACEVCSFQIKRALPGVSP